MNASRSIGADEHSNIPQHSKPGVAIRNADFRQFRAFRPFAVSAAAVK